MSEYKAALTPPGELINVKGRKVHVQRSGTDSPTVVFESGIFGDSLEFSKVQPEIAKVTSTISYDRAGMGYSEPSSDPNRVISVITKELLDLLETLKISKPVILVGWSAGGLYIRKFADEYPERVSGMVLIDSSVESDVDYFPDDLAQIFKQGRNDAAARLTRFSRMTRKEILDEFGSNPPWKDRHPDVHKYYLDRISPEEPKSFLLVLSYWWQEHKERDRLLKSLGDIPLTVIYAISEEDPQFNEEQNNQVNKIWSDLQRELAELSTQNRLIDVISGHDIANEEPEIVIEAILDIVNQVRSA